MQTLEAMPQTKRTISRKRADFVVPALDASGRFLLLGGPGGYLTCLPAGDPRLADQYRAWTVLARVNRPISPRLAEAARAWAVRTFRC